MRLGILGGGQLGRMLALAGYPLGVRCLFKDPASETPARLLAEQIVADYDDEESLDRLADRVDLVTYELENVPVEALYHLAERRSVFPAPRALKVMPDRFKEKRLCEQLGIPVPAFRSVNLHAFCLPTCTLSGLIPPAPAPASRPWALPVGQCVSATRRGSRPNL